MRTVPEDIAQKLVAGADRLTVGFEDVRMDDIARASGIPRATLYYHFPSRQDVLTFLHDAMLSAYRETVFADDIGPARERLTRLFDRLLGHVARHPGMALILISNLGQLGKLTELATATFDPLVSHVEQILADGVRAGEVREIDVTHTAVAISMLANTAATRALISEQLGQPELISEWLVALLWDGVAAAPA
ncbi:MAG TPA: TetR/AcrR family transcriptional regulator [Acidimicrobiales bacterium]